MIETIDPLQRSTSLERQTSMFEDEADLVERHIRSLTEVLKDLRRRAHFNRMGIDGESSVREAVERVLADVGDSDWHVLVDRKWPGTRRANLDVVVVGRPGVLILDDVRVDRRLLQPPTPPLEPRDAVPARVRNPPHRCHPGGMIN